LRIEFNQNRHEVTKDGKCWRYVDDILIITKMNETQLKEYVDKLNQIKSTIRFTIEFEKDDGIKYLDMALYKTEKDREIKTKWYRKPTAADRLLNYQSEHPKQVKTNIISNMTRRIAETTKQPQELEQKLKELKEI